MPNTGFSDADKKAFWEHKILQWEQGRYAPGSHAKGIMERLADRASDSLRFRLASAGEILATHGAGLRVVDLGCGSGRLGEAVLAGGAAHYHGIDVAESAITTARALAAEKGWGERASFEVATVAQLQPLQAGLVCSFGLMDWLTDDEIDHVFRVSGNAHFVHAIAERRNTPAQLVHRAYCWLAYGYRTAGYVPRYFNPQAFAAVARRHNARPIRIWRHPRLTFGAYLTTLPIGEPLLG